MNAAVALASSSELAAAAGAAVAGDGGNAVDAAVAAMLVSMNTEPGVCSLGGGGYLTVWAPGAAPVTLDGYVAVPGDGETRPASERLAVPVHLEYGGGVDTVVGPDSIGVPGGVAALGEAAGRWGRLPWRRLLEPVTDLARHGFPLPAASRHYLEYSGTPIYGRAADGHAALHHADGRLKNAGETVVVPHLADSLERIGRLGPAEFYTGELGRAMADFVGQRGGRLNRRDLAGYRVLPRPSLITGMAGWQIATNPPPAVGGAVLAAMLQMLDTPAWSGWDPAGVARLVSVQRAVLGYRRARLDLSDDLQADARALLEHAGRGELGRLLEAGSTCHTSAVDDTGLACSITMSAGYGAGEMAPGTGIWLNNCLGELELNKRGLEPAPPGTRLPSNMAPTAARSPGGEVLAIGSPGADRITTAICQALANHLQLGMPLAQAAEQARLHVEFAAAGCRVACEPGPPLQAVTLPVRRFEQLSMYFGGVGAAAWSPERGFSVAADPRRSGGTWCSPS